MSDETKDQAERNAIKRREWVSSMFGSRYIEATLSSLAITPVQMKEMSDWLKSPHNFLIYLGNPGCGKTYFCAAAMNYLFSALASRNINCRYWNERQFLSMIRKSFDDKGDYISLIKEKCSTGLMMLDDLGSSGLNDWRKEILFEFLDVRYENQIPTIITSNLCRKDFYDHFERRFCSRFFAKENTILEVEDIDRRK